VAYAHFNIGLLHSMNPPVKEKPPMEWGEAYDEGMALAATWLPSMGPKERDAFATGYARQKTRAPEGAR
jgi:hypothetical protein